MSEQVPNLDSILPPQSSGTPAGAISSAAPGALTAASPSVLKSAGASKTESGLTGKRDFLWSVHGYTNEYIRFADTKAGFCAGVASALIGALFATKGHELFVKVPLQDWTGLGYVSVWAFALLGTSVVIAIAVIRPRFWTHSEKGFIFWEAISRFETANQFATEYDNQADAELNGCLSHHLYSLAKVCHRKYLWLSVAILTATVGGLLAATVLLLKT